MSEESLGHFDVCLCGTSLSSSILAAALAKAGKSVIHLDDNDYYGAADASLALHELVDWARQQQEQRSEQYDHVEWGFPGYNRLEQLPEELSRFSRQYALSLAPSLVPAVSPFVDALVRAGVSRYTGFRLLEAVALCRPDAPPKRVPASKEDVFKDRDLSLPDKRRLMKFLLFAAGDFEGSDVLRGKEEQPIEQFLREQFPLDHNSLAAVLYAVALSPVQDDTSLVALQRLRRYLRATGKYGNSPFLVGQYGGAGELAQGFCRAAAVQGAVYMLGRKLSSLTRGDERFSLAVEGDIFTAAQVVAEPATLLHLRSDAKIELGPATHRAIVILDQPIPCMVPLPAVVNEETGEKGEESSKQAEAALFVFPPVAGGAPVRALMVGEAAFACPEWQHVLYLSTQASGDKTAKEALKPALTSLMGNAAGARIIFELYYSERTPVVPSSLPDDLFAMPRVAADIAEAPDAALSAAHAVFKQIMGDEEGEELFPPAEAAANNEEE